MNEDPKQITWRELVDEDSGDSLLDRWVAGRVNEEEDRSVAAYLLGSSFAQDEAALRLAIHHGTLEAAAARSPIAEGLKIVVRAAVGLLEVLKDSLQPLDVQTVPVRTAGLAQPTAHSFPLDAIASGAVLHIRNASGGRFALDLESGGTPSSDAEWILAGPGGRLVAAEGDEATAFSSVAPGTWTLERADGDARSSAVQLHLLIDE